MHTVCLYIYIYINVFFRCPTRLLPKPKRQRYDSDCLGCTAWASCTYCSVVGDYRVPMCMTTLEHTTSRALSGTLETLSLERGYWRVSDTSKIILKCYREAACAGGSTFKDYCSSGYDGPCKFDVELSI